MTATISITIHKNYLGIKNHIFYDGNKINVVNEKFDRLNDSYCLGYPDFYRKELIDMLPAIGVKYEFPFSDSLLSSYRQIYGDDIDWLRALGKEKFVNNINKFIKKLYQDIKKNDPKNYLSVLASGREILESFEHINVDEKLLRQELLKRDTSNLNSLLPIDGRACDIVRYSHDSQTGRMTVKNGPKVLLISKEDRRFFKPSDENNVLAQVDFVSLEPRVVYNLTHDGESKRDIYTSLGEEVGLDVSRAKLKISTISSLYGSSKVDPTISKKISSFFKLKEIESSYLSNAELYNFYGRPLHPEEEYLRLSHFVQSTAVDVALLGFTKFIKKYSVIPYFMIHDSLIFECSKEYYEELSQQDLRVEVNGLGDFYLELSQF